MVMCFVIHGTGDDIPPGRNGTGITGVGNKSRAATSSHTSRVKQHLDDAKESCHLGHTNCIAGYERAPSREAVDGENVPTYLEPSKVAALGLFGTASLHQNQFHSIKSTLEQFHT